MAICKDGDFVTTLSPCSSAWPLRGLVFVLLALTTSEPYCRTLFSLLTFFLHWQLLPWDLVINAHQKFTAFGKNILCLFSLLYPAKTVPRLTPSPAALSTGHIHKWCFLSISICSVLVCLKVSSPLEKKVPQITLHLLYSANRHRGDSEMLLYSLTCHHAVMSLW